MSEVKQSKKPEDNAFQQQRLKAWQPLLTPSWVIGTFLLVAIVFIPIGVVVLQASNDVVEYEQRYDTLSLPAGCNQTSTEESCRVAAFSVEIEEDMEAPIYVYYKLTNFYQNHRRYVKSRSDAQLRGETVTAEDLTPACDPLASWENPADTSEQQMLYPCGLIANSFFNDTFTARLTSEGTPRDLVDANWDKSQIAWKSDDEKFKAGPTDDVTRIGPGGFTLPDVTDPDFKVWMRTAGLPTFKKLYRIIGETDLKKGDTLEIFALNVFPVSGFDGEKSIVISTTSWLGGKNAFLGWAYIVVGVVCAVLAILFLIKYKVSPRDLGNMKYFNWPQISGGNGNAMDSKEQH